MCGIFGGVFGDSSDANGRWEVASDLLRHRGPDGVGSWRSADGAVLLGHRRLAILDLSERGAQPMADGARCCVVTFNGELYNYKEVRSELRHLGHRFETESDTEVLLEAYKEWGEECLLRFNGMFAFALYDRERRRLFCARDRYGEKPFLFVRKNRTFLFASEYKALLCQVGVSTRHDSVRLLQGLYSAGTGLDADRRTVFEDVDQLLPSEALVLDLATGAVRIWQYWEVSPQKEGAGVTWEEAVRRFRETLIDSVRLRMRSDVPVGSCLSGGLDSGAIVSIVRTRLVPEGRYHTFTGRFPGTAADEWTFAQEVVRSSRVESHVVEPGPEGLADELPEFMWFNELPVGSSSQYAQYCVFRLAREHGITVLLDGQGADELLGGYEQYFAFYVEALRELGQKSRLEKELPGIRSRYPRALSPQGRAWRDKAPMRARKWLASATGKGSNFLYGLSQDAARAIEEEAKRTRDSRFDALASALREDSFGRFLTALLRYGDRNSMAHSREVRLPFCDHRLAELVLSLPPEFLMGDIQTKRLLREAMRGLLPEPVRTRWNKQGFRPPQETWFRGRLMEILRDSLEAREFREDPLWDHRWWRKILERYERGETSLGWLLWQPLMASSWKRHFVARFEPAEA